MGRSEGTNGDHSTKKRTKKKGFSIFMYADAFDKWLMLLGFIGAVGDGLSNPVSLLLYSKMLNNVGTYAAQSSGFQHSINTVALLYVYLACGTWICCFLEGYCWTRTAERQAAKMRARYLKAVLRQDVAYFDLNVSSTSQVIQSVSGDILVIQDAVATKVPNFIMCAANFIGSYITGFIMLWRLTLVGFPFIVFLVIPGIMYGRTLQELARNIADEYRKAGDVVQQAVSSVRTVYSFVGENKVIEAFSQGLEESFKLGLKQGLAKGLAIGSNGVIFAIWSLMAYYGSRLVMYHGSRGGTVFAVGCCVLSGGLAMGSSLSNLKYFTEARSAGEGIMKVIQRTPTIDSDSTEGQILQEVSGNIEYKDVDFAYPSRPESIIFKSFSLKIPAGQTVALVGGSGSGKSTAIALLQRFYDPLAGEILLDGVSITQLQIKWLRSQMGLVSQEPALFATSIKENILFGKEDATMEEVVEAAKAANVHNFISQLPSGYNTQVGERGAQMSGGQKQRIAIARAIIKFPKILLLDEATSALDTESERIVQEALDSASRGRTTIIVAHRLSTIRNANLIAIVQNGQVIESGTHHDLLQNTTGTYSSLIHLQQQQSQQQEITPHQASSQPDQNTNTLSASPILHSLKSSSSDQHQPISKVKYSPQKKLPTPSFWRLVALNSPEWKQGVVGCISAFLFGAIQPTYAVMMASMVSVYFLTSHDEIKEKTKIYSLSFIGLAVLSMVASMVEHYNFGYMGEMLTKRVRESMLSKILTFEISWFDDDQNSTGAVCSRFAKDATVVRSLVGDRTALVVQTISAVTIACTIGLIISWRFALVLIAIQPIVIMSYYIRYTFMKNMSQKTSKMQEEDSKIAAEAMSNLQTVTAFSSQDRILKMLDDLHQGTIRECTKQAWLAGIGLGCSQGLMWVIWAFDFWYGGRLISQGYLTSKSFIQTFMIMFSTGRVISEAGSMTSDLAKGSSTVASVFGVLDRVTGIEPDDSKGFKPNTLAGQIELNKVHFAYPCRPDVVIFNDFTLEIQQGKSTALVGQSGSGKSTIIGLIERFYDSVQGHVMIDGRDIKSYNLRTLRKHIGLVGQEPTLFSGTIKHNILYGAPDINVTESELINASKAANAHEFISGLADGYETWCGDRGMQLSGGQKQRIAIARAILKNPAILLLDEATSALDGQSEKVVQEALERVMVGRTSVVVAHRLSTIQKCDAIAVLEKGKVVEKGSHVELMSKGLVGSYFNLVSIQR
ncbi:unnamed protein product [Rhodiola kirilowii]